MATRGVLATYQAEEFGLTFVAEREDLRALAMRINLREVTFEDVRAWFAPHISAPE